MLAPLPAAQTLERAQKLLQSGRSVALPELLKLIETLSTSDASVPEIAELIEKDAAILGKVLSVANTVAHNPGFAPIRTLSQAVHQIGYQRVRTMAVSLLLLESAGGSSTPQEQREAAGRALAAGLLAQGTAEAIGTHDAELAFACAALRQLGRILMAAISPELFRDALALAKKDTPEETCLRLRFGLTSLELSRKVLTAARVAPDVVAALRECEPETLYGTASRHETRLLGIADYANRLAAMALEPQSASDSFIKRSRQLARRYERLIPDAPETLKATFRTADDRLRSYLRCKGVASLPTVSLSRVRQRLEVVDPSVINEGDGSIGAIFAPPRFSNSTTEAQAQPLVPAAPEPASVPPLAAPIAAAPIDPTPELPSGAWEPIPDGRATPVPPPPPREAVSPAPTFAEDPRLAALALIRDGFGAEECWLFHQAPGATSFSGSAGLGDWWRLAQPRAAFGAGERTVFGVCLARREPVVIHDAGEPTTLPYLPEWYRASLGARGAFVLIPLSTADKLHGVAFIGWRTPRKITLSSAQLTLARQILSTLQPSLVTAA